MARILQFKSVARDGQVTVERPAHAAGEVVAMAHINLDTVVETVRVMRELDKIGLLDQFNGRGHAARAGQAKPSRK